MENALEQTTQENKPIEISGPLATAALAVFLVGAVTTVVVACKLVVALKG
jgi:hypothetical protein